MKVLYHHRTRGEDVEGVHIRGITAGLEELGHDVCIVSPFGLSERLQREVGEATTREKGAFWSLARSFASAAPEFVFEMAEMFYNFLAYWRLRRAAQKINPNIMYERYALFMLAGVQLAARRGIPIVLEINDSAVVERVRPLFFRALAKKFEKYILSRASGLVFVSSQFRKDCLREHGPLPPSIVAPNCADTGQFDPARFDKLDTRKRWGLPPSACVAGYVGAFVHWHGVQWFIESIAPRLHESPDLHLLLVGDGVDRASVAETVRQFDLEKRVILTGRLAHDEIPQVMRSMDFAVLPDSNLYGSPMKLFEFMAMGVPVLAPNLPPVAEVIQNEVNGWLFEPRNKTDCVEIALGLAQRPEQIAALGTAARRSVVELHQWKHNAEALIELTKKV